MTTEKAPEILLSVKDAVATITLNRPASGNAITASMILLLVRHLSELQRRDEVRVLVITGSGKYFCTGMDIRQGADLGNLRPHSAFDALWKFPKPVVCVMNGPALGGGVGLLLCCDIRIASSQAHIALPEVALGVYPALISAFVIPQLGIGRSQYLMLTGEKLHAAEFIAAGVAQLVVEPSGLAAATASVTQKLLRNSLSAQAGVKRLVQAVAYGGEDHDDLMGVLTGEFRSMMSSKERGFAAKHFAEKKSPPDWNSYYSSTKTTQSKL